MGLFSSWKEGNIQYSIPGEGISKRLQMLKQYFSTSLGCRQPPGLNHSPTSRRMWKIQVGDRVGHGSHCSSEWCQAVAVAHVTGTKLAQPVPSQLCSPPPALLFFTPSTFISFTALVLSSGSCSVSSFCFPHLLGHGQGDRTVVNSNCQARSSSSDLGLGGADTTENITLCKVRMGVTTLGSGNST